MEVFPLKISPERYLKIPSDVRSAWLAVGHVYNEHMLARKLLAASLNTKEKSSGEGLEIEKKLNSVQHIYLLKQLCSQLREAQSYLHKLTRVDCFVEFLEEDSEAKLALEELSKIHKGLIEDIRHKFGNHYGYGVFETLAPEEIDCDSYHYLCENPYNACDYLAEQIVRNHLISIVGDVKEENPLDVIFSEVVKQSKNLQIVCLNFTTHISKKYMLEHLKRNEITPVDVVTTNINESNIPVFIDGTPNT